MSEISLVVAAVQALKDSLDPSFYRQADIYVARSVRTMPPGCRLPAIGVKDGAELITQGTCNTDFITQQLEIVLWAASSHYAGQVLGDATQPGILLMQDHVEAVLRGNDFNGLVFPGSGRMISATASDELEDSVSRHIVQQKVLTFEFETKKQWPIS